jgi:hypothetical protein
LAITPTLAWVFFTFVQGSQSIGANGKNFPGELTENFCAPLHRGFLRRIWEWTFDLDTRIT